MPWSFHIVYIKYRGIGNADIRMRMHIYYLGDNGTGGASIFEKW